MESELVNSICCPYCNKYIHKRYIALWLLLKEIQNNPWMVSERDMGETFDRWSDEFGVPNPHDSKEDVAEMFKSMWEAEDRLKKKEESDA